MGVRSMSETLRRVRTLVLAGDVRVSDHGYEELRKDGILIEDAIASIAMAVAVEDYPGFAVPAFWLCSTTPMAVPSTSCGRFRRSDDGRLFL